MPTRFVCNAAAQPIVLRAKNIRLIRDAAAAQIRYAGDDYASWLTACVRVDDLDGLILWHAQRVAMKSSLMQHEKRDTRTAALVRAADHSSSFSFFNLGVITARQ